MPLAASAINDVIIRNADGPLLSADIEKPADDKYRLYGHQRRRHVTEHRQSGIIGIYKWAAITIAPHLFITRASGWWNP